MLQINSALASTTALNTSLAQAAQQTDKSQTDATAATTAAGGTASQAASSNMNIQK